MTKQSYIFAVIVALFSAAALSACSSQNKLLHANVAATVPAVTTPAAPPGPPLTERGTVLSFIDEMVAKHKFQRAALIELFGKVQPRARIVQIMTTPAEGKPWNKYRPIFVNDARIAGGVQFWRDNAAALAQAERQYGVPAEIIVAIIGVETRYGGNMGSFPVIDALATLSFDYPPRAPYFRGELEQFLLLAREEHLDPLAPKGSYAGAMGEAQFMPSSYRQYSVDFDGDGKRDLWHSTEDAIGSVAHYLSAYGWQRDQAIATRARVYGADYQAAIESSLTKPHRSVAQFKDIGVVAEACLKNQSLAMLVRLELEQGQEFWLGLDNFYVITRYNHSARYAMAVYQLSQAILAQRPQLSNGAQ